MIKFTKNFIISLFGLITTFIVLFVGFVIYIWSSETFEDHLYNAIHPQCFQQPTCKISLHELTPFVWDQAYIFHEEMLIATKLFKKLQGFQVIFNALIH
ncbi:unnamed protein product [Commensalibacter communis]|nr:unnamed protein product [Commensalibacter communis]CAI3958139.1 unnamed protein product [Commensalibacter communis]